MVVFDLSYIPLKVYDRSILRLTTMSLVFSFAAHPAFPLHWLRGQRPVRAQPPPILPKPGQPKWTFSSRPGAPTTPAAAAAAAAAAVAAGLSNMAGGAAPMGGSLAPPPPPPGGASGAGGMGTALYRNNSFNTAFTHRPIMEVCGRRRDTSHVLFVGSYKRRTLS